MKLSKFLRRYWPAVIIVLIITFGFPLLGRNADLVWWTDQAAQSSDNIRIPTSVPN